MLRILSTNAISEDQFLQIHSLEKLCRSHDGTASSISFAQELNFSKQMNCFFLLFEEDKLVGVLSVFAPVKGIAELSALIHPKKRRQGLFTSILSEAVLELEKYDIRQVYFVHDSLSMSGKHMIASWKILPDHSEYLLKYDKNYTSDKIKNLDIELREVGREDLNETTKLALDIFGGAEEEWTTFNEKSFSSQKILCFSAYIGKDIIGICNVKKSNQGLFIFGFGISPSFQRKGYGRDFLKKTVDKLLCDYNDDILLEVDSENNKAYNLYITSGFSVKVQFDYYKRSISDVSKLVSIR